MAVEQATSAKQTTEYLILYHIPEQTGQGWQVLADTEGEDTVIVHKGADAAKKHAVLNEPTLRSLAEQGGIEIVAVPLRSWQPTPVKLVPREPELKFG